MDDLRSERSGRSGRNTYVLHQRTPVSDRPLIAVPGYTGFVPGRNSEAVGEGTFRRVNSECRLLRATDKFDVEASGKPSLQGDVTQKDFGYTRRPRIPSPIPRDARGMRTPAAGDQHESQIMRSDDLPHGMGGPVSQTFPTGAIPRYGGYIPGKASENVFGDTWTKVNYRATRAHHMGEYGHSTRPLPRPLWDGRRNDAFRRKLSYERTVVPRVESDDHKEIPLINPSQQDLVRGTSSCPFTGKHIDPAGRQAPHGGTEGWGRTAPPQAWRLPGYQGYCVGKYAENVVGERQTRTEQIGVHLHRKNKLRITQK